MQIDLFSYNPKTDDILYQDDRIILINHDGSEVTCEAELSAIAEATGHQVDHYHRTGKPVFSVDNWAPGHWQPTDQELHDYMSAHKSQCVLEVAHDAIYDNLERMAEAKRMGITIIGYDEELKQKISELSESVNQMFHALKELAA